MKKILFSALLLVVLSLAFTLPAFANGNGNGNGNGNNGCTNIQSGDILDSNGDPIEVGNDQWGYNYQAQSFNGLYDNYNRPDPPVEEGNVHLSMKWNDAWLDNQDCDDDGELDRHHGHTSYVDSGAWLTNHIRVYNDDGSLESSVFYKIVALDGSDKCEDGVCETSEGVEIGDQIWGDFAIVQYVLGGEGAVYVSPNGPGLGN